jgi:hypothetical protein
MALTILEKSDMGFFEVNGLSYKEKTLFYFSEKVTLDKACF